MIQNHTKCNICEEEEEEEEEEDDDDEEEISLPIKWVTMWSNHFEDYSNIRKMLNKNYTGKVPSRATKN